MPRRHQVIIVGGGPVGHALAIALGLRGVSCAIIERHEEPVQIPKGQNLSNRSLEHFWFWGCADELRAARTMPPGYATGGITCYGTLISDHWHARGIERQKPVQDFYFQKNERLPQYCTEGVLRERAAAIPNITTYYGKIARSISFDNEGVSVTFGSVPTDGRQFYSWSADAQGADRTEGDLEILEGDYLVGCDGARSLVREALDIDRDGEDFAQRMVLAVFKSPELHAALERYPTCSTYRVLKPELEGYWQFFGRIDVGQDFFFHAPVPATATRENCDVKKLLEESTGIAFNADIKHVGFWDLRIKVAETYGKGRVFIAGDAAHQHPPYGGFGLNTGLEDAVNLAWKIVARLEGWGGDRLMESYGLERRPIIAETASDIIAAGIRSDRVWLEKCQSSEGTPAFEENWTAFGEQLMSYIKTYEPHYDASPVIWGPEGGQTSIHGQHVLAAAAGHHLVPRQLSSGRNVYQELGEGFTLLALGVSEEATDSFALAAAEHNIPLKIIRDEYSGELADYGVKLILVRPDQFIAWTGDGQPQDVRAILRRVAGH